MRRKGRAENQPLMTPLISSESDGVVHRVGQSVACARQDVAVRVSRVMEMLAVREAPERA